MKPASPVIRYAASRLTGVCSDVIAVLGCRYAAAISTAETLHPATAQSSPHRPIVPRQHTAYSSWSTMLLLPCRLLGCSVQSVLPRGRINPVRSSECDVEPPQIIDMA
jgi:hypothetical protein